MRDDIGYGIVVDLSLVTLASKAQCWVDGAITHLSGPINKRIFGEVVGSEVSYRKIDSGSKTRVTVIGFNANVFWDTIATWSVLCFKGRTAPC